MEEFEKQQLASDVDAGIDEAKLIVNQFILNSDHPRWFLEELPYGNRKFIVMNGDKMLMELKIFY